MTKGFVGTKWRDARAGKPLDNGIITHVIGECTSHDGKLRAIVVTQIVNTDNDEDIEAMPRGEWIHRVANGDVVRIMEDQ